MENLVWIMLLVASAVIYYLVFIKYAHIVDKWIASLLRKFDK